MSEPLPLILNDASLKISKTADETGLTELACVANHIELTPDTSVTTLDTMCGSRDYPGITKWSLLATLYQSFDTDATEEVLSAAVALDAPVPFELIPYKSQPVSATNPSWTGFLIPQPYSPINGDAGEASEVELEWALTGDPVKSITPGALATASLPNTHADLDELAAASGVTFSADDLTVAEKKAELEAARG